MRTLGKANAADINLAVTNLRKWAANQECYFCKKPNCDGYENMLVRIHRECSKAEHDKAVKALDKLK